MSEKSTFDFTNFKVDFTNFKVDFTNFKVDFTNVKVDFTNFKVDFTNFKNVILPTLKLAKRKKITKWHQEASVPDTTECLRHNYNTNTQGRTNPRKESSNNHAIHYLM